MLDLLKKNLMVGVGLASMTQDKIKDFGEKLAEESKLSAKEGEKLVKDLIKQAEDTKSGFEKQLGDAIEKVYSKIKLPCDSRFDKLEAEIISLKAEISKLTKTKEKKAKAKGKAKKK